MTVNQLAQEVVQFVAAGVQEVLAAYDAIARRSAAFAGQTLAALPSARALGAGIVAGLRGAQTWLLATGRSINRVGMQMRGLSMFARRFVLGGGVGLAGIFYGAAKNTVELDNFHKTITELAQTLGDKLAPYLRFVTDGIAALSAWWKTLDDATQRSVTRWALITVAVAGFVALLPILVRALGSLMMTLSLLANPYVAIPAVLLAIVAALLYVTAEGDTFAAKMESIAERVIMALFVIKAGFRSMAEEAGHAFKAAGSFLDLLRGGKPAEAAGKMAAAIGLIGTTPKRLATILGEEMAAAVGVTGQVKAIMRALGGAGEGAGFTRKPTGTLSFETGQRTWERMMTTFSEQGGQSVERQMLAEAQKQTVEQQEMNKRLQGVADKLPVVR